MKKAIAVAILVGALAPVTGFAQVHKCKDATGKTIYSDAPCTAGATGGAIRLRENSIDTRVDWERNQRYIRQRQAEDRQAPQRISGNTRQTVAGDEKRMSPACRTAINNANTQGLNATPAKIDGDRGEARRICGFDPWPGPSLAQVDAENRRSEALKKAAKARMNPTIASCDAGGCWDTEGNRYNGSNGAYHRTDGAFCTGGGNSLSCR